MPARLTTATILAVLTCGAFAALSYAAEPERGAAPPAAQPAQVPVKQVVLFSSGVGYLNTSAQ
jgi:hypothetical protein